LFGRLSLEKRLLVICGWTETRELRQAATSTSGPKCEVPTECGNVRWWTGHIADITKSTRLTQSGNGETACSTTASGL
jgi:hypothetical protein